MLSGAASKTSSFTAGAVVQKRTPSLSLLRNKKAESQRAHSVRLLVTSLKKNAAQAGISTRRRVAAAAPFLAREKDRVLAGLVDAGRLLRWRTAEALAVAAVFTMVVSASIRHVSSFRASGAPLAVQQDTTTKKDLALTGQAGARLKSQLEIRDADFVA